MKIYVVFAYNYGNMSSLDIIYVGTDEYEAFNINFSDYESAEIEVWEDEKKLEAYKWSHSSKKWRLEYYYNSKAQISPDDNK